MEPTQTRTTTPWLLAGSVAGLVLLAGGCSCGGEVAKACTSSNQCAATETCQDAVCTTACNPACAAGEVCDDGACFPRNCERAGCTDNAFCFEDKCTPHGCRGVTCASDKTCTLGGNCVAINCSGGGGACDPATEACDPETKECNDASCIGVSCPPGQTCWGGSCRSTECEDGRQCAGTFCAEGGYCKDCADKPCAGTDLCVDGVCRPRGCVFFPQRDCPCGPSRTTCALDEVCVGATPEAERCLAHDCSRTVCGPGFVCAGDACKPVSCVDVRCGEGETCAADGKCYPVACGAASCPDGTACVGGACAPISCVGKTCPEGQTCFNGGCYKTNVDCAGVQCNAPKLCVNGLCTGGYEACEGAPGVCPPKCGAEVCADGYTCDQSSTPPRCVPMVCVNRECPGLCGEALCQPDELCDQSSGTCVKKCPNCPEGFVCAANYGSCIPVGCLAKTCPEGFICGPDGNCLQQGGGDEDCDEGEALLNGECVELACIGKDCGANGTCMGGTCYTRCCEGAICGGETLECGGDGVCLNCRQYYRNCRDHRCKSGYVCDSGSSCVMINPPDWCLQKAWPVPPTAETLTCNGADEDHNCVSDDYTWTPVPYTSGAQRIVDGPRTVGGETCGRCVSGATGDYSCAANFADGRVVVMYLSDKNTGQRTPVPKTSALNDNAPENMTACIRFKTPCARFAATRVDVLWRGVETSRPCADKLPCGTSCGETPLVVFFRKAGQSSWTRAGGRHSRLEIDKFRSFPLAAGAVVSNVAEVLVCRGDASTLRMDVAVDGVSMQGCCR